ncbi:MAG: hypothetical protein ACR2L9_10655 [Solirubrobacteraceae bacterium]
MKRGLAFLAVGVLSLAAFSEVALAASSPSVNTGSSSKVTQKSAVLSASINPNGSTSTYYFQWGLTTGYGFTSRAHSAGHGTTAVAVTATAGGLVPGTVFHYRVVAFNKFGTSAGADRTFKTKGFPLPQPVTGPAIAVGTTFVTLTGIVNPNGTTTSYYFQYGTTGAYGSQTFPGKLPASHTAQVESVPITGLSTGTIFHYRMVAIRAGFPPLYGLDQIFMTEPRIAPVPRLRARTLPHRSRHRPFVFTTSGTISGPSWIPAQFACTGQVKIRVLHGFRTVGLSVAAVAPNCTFSAQTVLTRKPGHGAKNRRVTLVALIHFLGNGYLARAHAHPETVVVG